ncbi:DUF1129 domain-containing protein [Bacillus sp. Y1]|nr:DUF1129 family protein [Bacillus sp. Y1]AYA74838.1 DUF1129 domain-containing protein [Bacillus sp. Y1]
MKAKQLIEENNRKRERLTKENEKYYGDMLVYIRLQLTLSEQQSEEVLMEMLDHLLEAQNEGKTAKDIFGPNPKQYADEIIENLPKEKKRQVLPFISGLALNVISYMLIMRSIVILIGSQFKEITTTVYPLTSIIVLSVILASISFGVWYIFKIIKDSLFLEKPNNKKDMIKAGIFGSVSMALIIVASKLMPEIGPSFSLSWWASLLCGCIIWIAGYGVKKIEA